MNGDATNNNKNCAFVDYNKIVQNTVSALILKLELIHYQSHLHGTI